MKSFFNWLRTHLIMDETPTPAFEAGAVATRVGDAPKGFSEWKVVVQIRHPAADYDAVYTCRWVSKGAPDVSDIVSHYQARPQDFEFLDFLPNRNKQQSG